MGFAFPRLLKGFRGPSPHSCGTVGAHPSVVFVTHPPLQLSLKILPSGISVLMGFAASPARLLALPVCNLIKCPKVPEKMSLL